MAENTGARQPRYRLIERASGPAGTYRTTYEIRDQDDRCVSRPRGYAKALREVEFLNKQADAKKETADGL